MAQENAFREYQEYLERNHAMFILIGGMLAAVAIFFMLFIEEGGLETGIILVCRRSAAVHCFPDYTGDPTETSARGTA